MRGSALDLRQQILGRILAAPDRVWTPVDFIDLGARAAVDKALQRLVTTNVIRRIGRGLYDHPRFIPLIQQMSVPYVSAVIDAIVRRDQIRVLIDGMTAANDLGLTTAVPARVNVLTDARLRPVRLGNREITFQQAAPSRLYWAGRPAMRVVQALHWLQDAMAVDQERILVFARLGRVLADTTHGAAIRADLQTGLHTLPIWMQAIVRDLVHNRSTRGSRFARTWTRSKGKTR